MTSIAARSRGLIRPFAAFCGSTRADPRRIGTSRPCPEAEVASAKPVATPAAPAPDEAAKRPAAPKLPADPAPDH